MKIQKAAVIGAGVMGAAIAAQLANAGIPVTLLDVVPPGATDRSQLAKAAIERMLKTEPAPLMNSTSSSNCVTASPQPSNSRPARSTTIRPS